MGNLGTNLATGLATNVATNLAGGYPLPVPGFLHWLDCANGITPNGGDAAAVLDRISGDSWAQGTPAAQPLIVAAGPSPSGIGCLRFDGVDDYLSLATPAATEAFLDGQTYSLYAALRLNSTSAGTVIGGFDESGANDRSRLWVSTTLRLQVADAATAQATSGSASTATDYWAYGSANGRTTHSAQLRGGVVGADATDVGPLANTHTSLAVGVRLNSTPQQFASMDLYHAFIFDHELTASEHAAMQAWLDTQMGL